MLDPIVATHQGLFDETGFDAGAGRRHLEAARLNRIMDYAVPAYRSCWPLWTGYLGLETGLYLAMVRFDAFSSADGIDLSDATAEACLAKEEWDCFAGFGRSKRQREWLGGRLAVKSAVAGMMGLVPDLERIRIGIADKGRPVLIGWPGQETGILPPAISISHSGPLAAALASDLPCGLDLQVENPKILRVVRRFVLPGEEELLAGFSPVYERLSSLGLLWAVKEAVRKIGWSGELPDFLDIRLRMDVEAGGVGRAESPFGLQVEVKRPHGTVPIRAVSFLAENTAWALACRLSTGMEEG